MFGEVLVDLLLVVVLVVELVDLQKEIYIVLCLLVYFFSEDIDCFGWVFVGDLFQGILGVQVGDSCNGGVLDVNICGIQGQSWVVVWVDGVEQVLDVYCGYVGIQQCSYIDFDLVSSVIVDKGFLICLGVIGGSVEMCIIGVKDILVDGKDFGVCFIGDVWNNGVVLQYCSVSLKIENFSSVLYDDCGSLFGFQVKFGSVVFVYCNEYLDLVVVYVQCNQGNYFFGKKGQDCYCVYNCYGCEESSVVKVYNVGEEVFNLLLEIEFYLFKVIWCIVDEYILDFGYCCYDGCIGEIMLLDIFCFGIVGIYQYLLSEVKIDIYIVCYCYLFENNLLVDFSIGLWMIDVKSDMLILVLVLCFQVYCFDCNWMCQDNWCIGGDLNNVVCFEIDFGDFKFDFGGLFQVEDIQLQKSVVIIFYDINVNCILRDVICQEYGFNGKFEFKLVECLMLWGGGCYSYFNSKDNGIFVLLWCEDCDMCFIMVSRFGYYGLMMWFFDQNGQYIDVIDLCFNNGIVINNINNLFEGIFFDEFGLVNVMVYFLWVINVVIGYNYSKKGSSCGGGFLLVFGINFELVLDIFVYVFYIEGLCLLLLFEISQGIFQVELGKDFKFECLCSWEIGVSVLCDSLLVDGDLVVIKLVYFNNIIKNYIICYYDLGQMGLMIFSNIDSYCISGFEL